MAKVKMVQVIEGAFASGKGDVRSLFVNVARLSEPTKDGETWDFSANRNNGQKVDAFLTDEDINNLAELFTNLSQYTKKGE